MSDLKRRLRRLEPPPFEPVMSHWRLERANGVIEEGFGTLADLDIAVMGPDCAPEESEVSNEQHSSPTNKA